MNPAILNYWQSQQQIGDQMQLLNNNAQSADNAQMSVGANPFDAGIQRAISTARDSLGMTEKQQDRALRRSLLNFAANIAQTPKQKGFFNNFGAISRAALPAISEYDNAEAEAEMANNALANQILNYQKGLRGEEFEREKFNSQAKFQQDQLAETKRYHDLINDFNLAKTEAKNNSAIDSNTNPYGYDNKTLGYVARKNVDEQKEIHKKMSVQKRSNQLISEYKGRLKEAGTARDEFLKALEKDRKELLLIRKDIVTAKKKLGALQAAKAALKESIEISEESLEKISGRSRQWSDNRSGAAGDLKDVSQELIILRKQKKEQAAKLKQNQASLKKWRKSYVGLSDSLQKLTLRLKTVQRGKKK